MKTVRLDLTREQAKTLLGMLEEKSFYATVMQCMVDDETAESTKESIIASSDVCQKLAKVLKEALTEEDVNDLLKV